MVRITLGALHGAVLILSMASTGALAQRPAAWDTRVRSEAPPSAAVVAPSPPNVPPAAAEPDKPKAHRAGKARKIPKAD